MGWEVIVIKVIIIEVGVVQIVPRTSGGRGRSRVVTRGESSVAVSLKGVRPIISEVCEGISLTPLTGHRVFGNGGHGGV